MARQVSEKVRLAREIEEARQRNALYGERGRVRLHRQYHFRDNSVGDKRWRKLPGFRNISVCAGAKKWKAVAPAFLGPITDHGQANAPAAQNLENLWRFIHIWPEDLQDGQPSADWMQRRNDGFQVEQGKRLPRALRRDESSACLGVWWSGQLLDEVRARREVFCPLYTRLVERNETFKELDMLVQQGYNLQLFGYQAFDFVEQGLSLRRALDDVSQPFGHEIVLYALLTRQRIWEPEALREQGTLRRSTRRR